MFTCIKKYKIVAIYLSNMNVVKKKDVHLHNILNRLQLSVVSLSRESDNHVIFCKKKSYVSNK